MTSVARDGSRADSRWGLLASRWDALFPTRPARVELCMRRSAPGDRVLDAGCATGGLVRALADRERDARGFDLDPGFVAEARRLLGPQQDRVQVGDLREIASLPSDRAPALIVCLGQTFPHLLGDDDVLAFLAGCRQLLSPSGRLLVQVVSDAGAPSERDLPPLEAPGLVLFRRRILVDAGRARLELRARTGTEEWSWSVEHRRWAPEALAGFAARCGLTALGVACDESGAPWTGSEPGWILELGVDGGA